MNIIPSTSSRSRAPNFTREEQELLCDVLKPFMHIIESKKTDGVKHGEKQAAAAWAKVTETFNGNTKYTNRTTENLLLCYRNMKAKIKKEHSTAKMNLSDPRKKEAFINAIEANGNDWNAVSSEINEPAEVCESGFKEMKREIKKKESQYRKTIMGTGGGPPPPDYDKPLMQLKKIIEPQIDGLYTIYDGDSLLMAQYQESVHDSEKIKPIEYEVQFKTNDEVIAESEETKKEGITTTPISFKNRVDLLRRKKATPLNCTDNAKPSYKKKEKTSELFQTLAEQKLELVQIQKQVLLNDMEHQSKMQQLQLEETIQVNKYTQMMREKDIKIKDLELELQAQTIKHCEIMKEKEFQIKELELQLKEKELLLLDKKINKLK